MMLLKMTSAISVRARIIIGFGLLVLLLASISLLYDSRLRSVRTNVTALVTAANASEKLRQFQTDIENVRRTVTAYTGSYSASEQVAAVQAQKQALARMDEVQGLLSSRADEMTASLKALQTSFAELVAQNKERQKAYSALGAANSRLRNLVTNLVREGSRQDGFDVTIPMRLLQNAQAYTTFASRYALRGSGGDADQAMNELTYLQAEYDTLKQTGVTDAWLKATIAALDAPVATLEKSLASLKETTKNIQAAAATLQKTGIAIGEHVIAVNEQFVQELASEEHATLSMVETVLWTGAIAAAGSVAFGLIIAFFISVGIVRLVTRITSTMEVLVKGDFSVSVPEIERRDEIGAMARAVEVFRQNGIRAIALEDEAQTQRNLTNEERNRNTARERKHAEAMAQATSGLATGLAKLAEGQLTFQISEPFAEEFENLRLNFNTAVAQLRDTMVIVSAASDSITQGSQEISRGSDDLSKRTERQAAALEQTAAALDEIMANVVASRSRVDDATAMAARANSNAKDAGIVVSGAIDAINKISSSSNEISNIIGVIDQIAFQTNLLALNAGVEAARAGDAGKGFAVVAQEVRELAQRSAQAAREIKGLIDASLANVENGVELVNRTGQALQAIESCVVVINEQVQSIAAGGREQATGLQEINTAINSLDQVTQQNAAMVEESSAASATLLEEVYQLKSMIAKFQTGTEGVASATARRAVRERGPDERVYATAAGWGR